MYLTQVYKITNHCGVHKIVISDTSVKKTIEDNENLYQFQYFYVK